MQKKLCVTCGKFFQTNQKNQVFCSRECMGNFRKLRYSNKARFDFEDEKLFVRLVKDSEDHSFKTLRQAVNYLSAFTKFDAAEVFELLKSRAQKIGSYRIFY